MLGIEPERHFNRNIYIFSPFFFLGIYLKFSLHFFLK